MRSWTYDALDNRLTATDGGVTTTFRYTALGRVEELEVASGYDWRAPSTPSSPLRTSPTRR